MHIDYSIEVAECEPLPGYRLKVKCSDGASGMFDMSKYMDRGTFREVAETNTFDKVRLAHGVPTWPNGIDIAPKRIRSDMVPA